VWLGEKFDRIKGQVFLAGKDYKRRTGKSLLIKECRMVDNLAYFLFLSRSVMVEVICPLVDNVRHSSRKALGRCIA
jgi:hypothetical protein